jgi:prepilin-type N-terminal cleavage/methylation domain-containing protein
MNASDKKSVGGFTLMELTVVISIILILISIVFASSSEARKSTRDKKRVSDLANIEFALTLYKAKNRSYLPATTVEAGFNSPLDTITRTFNGNVYRDPMSTVAGSAYGYWYSSNFTCTQADQAIVLALQMERPKNANFTSVCTGASDADKTSYAKSYIVVLKE